MLDRIPNCVGSNPFYTRYTRKAFEAFARLVFRYYCPLQVIGGDNLPQRSFILCSNHSSHMDSIVLMAASCRGFDRFGLLAASDYFFRNPLVYRWFSSMVNLIPISRRPTAESLHYTVALCRKFVERDDRNLIVFPEGTRSRNGTIGAFKPGVGMLSTTLGLPIVPAYIQGTREAMPKGRLFPSHRRVTVRIGPPIYPDPNGGKYERLADTARSRIDEMKNGGGF